MACLSGTVGAFGAVFLFPSHADFTCYTRMRGPSEDNNKFGI